MPTFQIFGNNVEDRMGHVRYLLFYLVCGYAAAYGFALTNTGSPHPLIGASGAVAGVLGAYLVLYPKARVWVLAPFLIFLPLRLPAWIVLGMWFALQAVYSSGGGVTSAGAVAYVAHVVGFVAGMLLAWPLKPGTPPPPRTGRHPLRTTDARGLGRATRRGPGSARKPGTALHKRRFHFRAGRRLLNDPTTCMFCQIFEPPAGLTLTHCRLS
ncbi:hypothetical protein SHIRM173S_07231 [Streptomyces hirsutus]